MKLKRGIDPEGVHQLLWGKLALADREHQIVAGEPLVVTSLRRDPKPGSGHSPPPDVPATAADIRRWRLDALGLTESFCSWLQKEGGLAVLLEPDWMTKEQIAERGGIDRIAPHNSHSVYRGKTRFSFHGDAGSIVPRLPSVVDAAIDSPVPRYTAYEFQGNTAFSKHGDGACCYDRWHAEPGVVPGNSKWEIPA